VYNAFAGYIDAIDYTTGTLVIEQDEGVGAKIRINDPTGKYGLENSQRPIAYFDDRSALTLRTPRYGLLLGFLCASLAMLTRTMLSVQARTGLSAQMAASTRPSQWCVLLVMLCINRALSRQPSSIDACMPSGTHP
jgi:hypothetical protein